MVRQAYSSLQKRTKDLSELLRRNQFLGTRNGDGFGGPEHPAKNPPHDQSQSRSVENKISWNPGHTVDGRNPQQPPRMYKTLLIMR